MDEAESLTPPSGSANTTLFSFQNAVERRCICNCANILVRVPQTGGAEEEPDRGRAFDVRPCAHDDLDPAEIRRVTGGRLYQGREWYPLGVRLWQAGTEFCQEDLLTGGVFVSTVGRDEEVIRSDIRNQE
jgi:hypothetical protein